MGSRTVSPGLTFSVGHDHRLALPRRTGRRLHGALGQRRAARRLRAAGGAGGDRANGALRRISFRLRRGQPRGCPHRRTPAGPLSRPGLRARGARPRADRRDGARGCRTPWIRRDQAAPPRRQHHARGVRCRQNPWPDGAVRRGGRGGAGRTPRRAVPGRRLHRAAPRQLRRRLARPAGADRPSGTSPPHLHRHRGRAPLRPAGPGGAARRRAQGAVRHRRPLAAPGGRAGKDQGAGPAPAGRGVVLGRNFLRLTARARARACSSALRKNFALRPAPGDLRDAAPGR